MEIYKYFALIMILVVAAPLFIELGKFLLKLISKYQQKLIKKDSMPQELKKALDMAYHKGFEEGIDKHKRDVAAAFEAKSRAILAQHLEKMKTFQEGLDKEKKKTKRGRK